MTMDNAEMQRLIGEQWQRQQEALKTMQKHQQTIDSITGRLRTFLQAMGASQGYEFRPQASGIQVVQRQTQHVQVRDDDIQVLRVAMTAFLEAQTVKQEMDKALRSRSS